jgi:hypothetical protein
MGIRVNSTNLLSLQALTQKQREGRNIVVSDNLVAPLEISLSEGSVTPLKPTTKLSNELQRSFAMNSLDENARNESTSGIGNRAVLVTTEDPQSIFAKFPAADVISADTSLFDANASVTQEDMTQIRSAITKIASDYTLWNATSITKDNIATEIDRQLGSGVADIFNIHVVDAGAGKSVIQIDNVDAQSLTDNQRRSAPAPLASS